MSTQTTPAKRAVETQNTIDELRWEAKSPEDLAYVEDEQSKHHTERQAAIGGLATGVTRLAIDHEGIVHDATAVEDSIVRGEEQGGASSAGRLS